MKRIWKAGFLFLAPALLAAQTNTQSTGTSSTTSYDDEVKALRLAMAQQQQQLAQQQQLMVQQKQRLESLKTALAEDTSGTPHVENVALNTAAPEPAATVQAAEKPKESPLSFRIGGAEFTPGGFVDFENIFRTT